MQILSLSTGDKKKLQIAGANLGGSTKPTAYGASTEWSGGGETRRCAGSTYPADPALPAERQTVVTAEGRLWRGDSWTPMIDAVAEEVPVALVYNGVSHAVMMATPAHLEDFALGFSLTEGILENPSELFEIEVQDTPDGVAVQMTVAARRFQALKERRRNLTGRTGCGLCGVDSLEEAVRPVRAVAPVRVGVEAIRRAVDQLPQWQALNDVARSLHAAAWADRDGRVLLAREDVGRHNALDKLIGAMVAERIDPATGFAIVTSRCSYELVQKATAAGISILVAVSAPTALAMRIAEAAGLALVALARADSFRIYTYPERIGSRVRADGAGDA